MSLAPIIVNSTGPVPLPFPGLNASHLSHDMLAAKSVMQATTSAEIGAAAQVATSLAHSYKFKLPTPKRRPDSAVDPDYFKSISIPRFASAMRHGFEGTIFSRQLYFQSYDQLAVFSAMLFDIAEMGLLTFDAADTFHLNALDCVNNRIQQNHAFLSRGIISQTGGDPSIAYGTLVLVLGTALMIHTGSSLFKILTTVGISSAIVFLSTHRQITIAEAEKAERDLRNLWKIRDDISKARRQLHDLKKEITAKSKESWPPIHNRMPK